MGSKTAVQWLQEKLFELEINIDSKTHEEAFFIFEEAKQMEAMQLESCAIHFTDYATECLVLHKQMDGEKHFEQYYFNNYGKW
jgi:hypothetical protein